MKLLTNLDFWITISTGLMALSALTAILSYILNFKSKKKEMKLSVILKKMDVKAIQISNISEEIRSEKAKKFRATNLEIVKEQKERVSALESKLSKTTNQFNKYSLDANKLTGIKDSRINKRKAKK